MKNIKLIFGVFSCIFFTATLLLSAQNLSYPNGKKIDETNSEFYNASKLIIIEISGSGDGGVCWGNECDDANGHEYGDGEDKCGDVVCCGESSSDRGQKP